MWTAYNTNQLHYPSKRELEKERLAFLRHQVEEKRILEEERRLKEIYDDQLVEQNVLRQREKLRLEYEADLAKQQAKDRAASKKQDEHIAKIASLEREAEEAKRVKFASRGRRPKNSSSTPGATPEIPRIVIDTVDDRPIKPTKKTRKGSSVDKPKSSIKPKSSNTKSSKKKSASKNLPSVAMPRAGTAMPPRTGMGQSNIRKSSSHGEVTKLQYHPENNEEINIQEKNGKRRKLPSRRTDDFGMHIQSASKPIVVNDETLTSTIYDAKIRPRPRKKPLPARLRNTPSETESRFTPRSAPLPPITRTEESPERPATDPSPSSTRETDSQSKYEDPPRRPVLMSAGIQTDAWEEKDKSKDIDDTGMGMEEFNLDELEEGDHHPFTDEENRDSPTPPPTERVATPPPFDWRIQIEKEEADKEGHEEQKKKKMKKFKKKNVGFLSQLSALRKGLKQPADNDDDDGDDDDDDDDISDEKGEEKEEEKQKENEEEDANNDSNDDLEDDFNRKVSLGDTHRLDLEATNKTILRNFMTRANQSKTASTSE